MTHVVTHAKTLDPIRMLKPKRRITGMSAILMPFAEGEQVDWDGLRNHIAWTADCGLWPAVNMDTGYGHLIDEGTRKCVLEHTQDICGNRPFVAGAFVTDTPGDAFNLDAYRKQIDIITEHGGVPVIFQSHGLIRQEGPAIAHSYTKIGESCERFIGFELGQMFAPFGMIYDLETYGALIQIPQCIGAKHSSLSRVLEWQRLILRDELRPDFMVLTGNDWAIDMVMYGSDYLLGLSTFAPDLFAKRDAMWAAGDPGFYELNDMLQYLGHFAFRDPIPAYKHNAAQFLKLRGRIGCDATHPQSSQRSDGDRDVLQDTLTRLSRWIDA